MRRFIIDTDAASDDAVAMILALRDPNAIIEAITIVAGRMTVDKGSINARVAEEVANRAFPPVYEGMTKPLWRKQITGENAHGEDGLSDVGLAHTTLPLGKGHAVDKIIDHAQCTGHEAHQGHYRNGRSVQDAQSDHCQCGIQHLGGR